MNNTNIDKFWMLPKEFKQAYAQLAAKFVSKTGAPIEDVQEFMVEVLKIYFKYEQKETVN